MRSRREARLRAEYAAKYPYLSPDRWEPAAVMADRVLAHTLGRPNGRFITGERALDPTHFEFRGWDPNTREGATRREDTDGALAGRHPRR